MQKELTPEELYYTPPIQSIFEEIQTLAISIWRDYDDKYSYASNKIAKIKELENIQDNAMYMFAMFDIINQNKMLARLSPSAKQFILSRLAT